MSTEMLTDADYIQAVTPFYNGCAYRAVFRIDGSVAFELGCYGVHVNLVQGAQRVILGMVDEEHNRPFAVPITPEAIHAVKDLPQCRRCGGPRYETHL